MISSEVQRTLVKSPPELWAELSDPALLARHLGELGEIRITRVEPEQKVEWVAENASGTVQIKPSGWGTRVTLTVSRELSEDQAEELDADPAWLPEGVASFTPEPLPAAELERESGEMQSERVEAEPEPLCEDALQAEPYGWLTDDEPEPRRGFFARLFGRRRGARATTEPAAIESLGEMDTVDETDSVSELAEDAAAGETEPKSPELVGDVEAPRLSEADTSPAPAPESWQADPPGDPILEPPPVDDAAPHASSSLTAGAEAATAEMTAVLTSVLDRLGAAHHRPFSRS